MKKIIIMLIFALAVTGAFAESEFILASGNSFCDIIKNNDGTNVLWAENWPMNLGLISISYMYRMTDNFLLGTDVGIGPWSEYLSADAAYEMPVFTVGDFNVSLRGTAKLGVYILFDPDPVLFTDVELLAKRPGKSFFFGTGISNATCALWNKSIDESNVIYSILDRPCVKFTAGWKL